jgi:protoporphyrin/coproporphyrin ferrochelatase
LLVNLGTPDAPTTGAVRRYLREFLSDPRVIDIGALARWLLVNLIIAPFRAPRSAAQYRTIWGPEGSPLLVHSRALTAAVARELGDAWRVALGMRYGNPSIAAALRELDGVARLVVLPLYPQYASASNGSSVERVLEEIAGRDVLPAIELRGPFETAPDFIEPLAAVHRETLAAVTYDHILFSYHGLPERHVARAESPDVACDRRGPCPTLSDANRFCYRAGCYATSRALATALQLDPARWSVAFQSRLGRTPWIRPDLDEALVGLRQKGVTHLAISCPSFTADCLETVEEIGVRARQRWRELGGASLHLVPCLNAHPAWVRGVTSLALTGRPAIS